LGRFALERFALERFALERFALERFALGRGELVCSYFHLYQQPKGVSPFQRAKPVPKALAVPKGEARTN
jgi:hypothetical protein